MALQQPDRLKAVLLSTGLQQKDPALYQVIVGLIDILRAANIEIDTLTSAPSGGGSGAAITALTTDVVATGPGEVPAIIQPLAVTTGKIDNLAVTSGKIANDAVITAKILDANVTTPKIADNNVTYGKIQQVSAVEKLLGNGDVSAPANVQEIGLGANLEIQGSTLQIIPTGGSGVGLAHKVLSDTHSDSLPADAVLGDLIYAGPGADFEGAYAHGLLNTAIVEDFTGIRGGYLLGFNYSPLPTGNSGWGAPPPLDFITNPLPDTWLAWITIDGFLQTSVIEDFEGNRAGYTGGQPGNFPYITPRSGGYSGLAIAIIPAPDLANPLNDPIWQRLPISETTGQVLQKDTNGLPAWSQNLTLAGNAVVTGNVSGANVAATGQVTAGTNVIALGNVQAPTINGRTLGVWTDVTFNAGDFTANGGTTPTWTLTSPDQVLFRYCYIGNGTMMIQIYLATTSVASVAGNVTELRIKIPDSKSAIGANPHLVGAQENGVAVFDVFATADPSVDATMIFIRTYPVGAGRAFNQTPNASYFAFTIVLRIA